MAEGLSEPAPQPNIVSPRLEIKKYLQRFRESQDYTTGMDYSLNQAISNLADDEPTSFEKLIGRPRLSNDLSKPVLRLSREHVENEEFITADEPLPDSLCVCKYICK